MTTIDRGPTRVGRWTSAVAGVVAFVTSGFYSWSALAVGTIGLGLLLVGVVRGAKGAVTTGAFGLLVAGVLAGSAGAPVPPILASVVFTVLAWDTGGNAIGVGEQLGRSADTARIEIVHAVGTLAVGVLTAAVGSGVYWFAAGGQPVAAVVFLLLGALLLLGTLGQSPE